MHRDALSPQEQRFCNEYAANGGNATKAAIAAGYSEATAAQTASRLLKRPRVHAEIRRLFGARPLPNDPPRAGHLLPVVAEPAARQGMDGDVMPPADEADVELRSRLNRDWIIARLMRNAMICLGEMKKTTIKVLTASSDDGKVTATAVQVEGFAHDPTGANTALALLSKELDAIEGRLPPDRRGADQLPGRQMFEEAMQLYARAAQAKAPATNGNGHAKPNGNGAGHG